jgi:proteasome accessory factor B
LKNISDHRGASRPPLERMMVLHSHLQARKFPNCRKIADELEVSSKSIQRDIDFMRYRLGLPIEYDPLRFGYYYSEAVEAFPAIEVSEGEVTALFVAQKALAQYKGTPYEQPLRTAFRKLTDSLTDRISFSWSELDNVISFHTAGASVADLQLFKAVSEAVLHSREIVFAYQKLRSTRYEERRVEPYHLASVENQWYLFAFDAARKQVRTFALPRMRNVRATGGSFTRPQNFSAAAMLSQSFGVFSSSGKHRVRIRFDAFAARLIAERVWHESQKIKRQRDGSIVLELELGSLEEIERWILSWGTHARALAPTALVQRIKIAARQLAKSYA